MPTGVPLAPASPDPSEVHNVGEIWTQTLFQGYINLLGIGPMQTPARTFAESQAAHGRLRHRRHEGRPAESDLHRAARRHPAPHLHGRQDGCGSHGGLPRARARASPIAVSVRAPSRRPSTSITLNEAVEDFSIKGSLDLDTFTIDDSTRSCDNDGVLDAGEQGVLKIKIANVGWETLTGSTVTVTSTDPNITFGNGGTRDHRLPRALRRVGGVDPDRRRGAATPQRTLATLTVTMANAAAVKPSVPVSVIDTRQLRRQGRRLRRATTSKATPRPRRGRRSRSR